MISLSIFEALCERESVSRSDVIVAVEGRHISAEMLRGLVEDYAVAARRESAQPASPRWIAEDDPVAFIAQCLACRRDGAPAIIGTNCLLRTAQGAGEGSDVPADVAFVLHTSGSTGQTVGVMTSEQSFVENVRDMLPYVEPGQIEHWFVCSPLSTSYGMSLGLWLPLFLGGALHPVSYLNARARLLELLHSRRPAVVATPTVYRAWLEWPELLAGVARVAPVLFASGEPLAPGVAQRYAALGLRLLDCYGSTESNGIAVCDVPGSGVFTPLASVETHLQRDAGETSGGALLVRGPKLMRGYWGSDALSKMRIRDGWLDTGDWVEPVGGKFRIVGRKSSLVKIAGQRVHPEQVERELESLPDVAEALVGADPDDRRGEALVAYVKPRQATLDPAELRAALAQRLPRYMVPRRVILVEEFSHLSHKKRRSLPTSKDVEPS